MADNSKYITLSKDNFQAVVVESPTPVLVDFWADWCGPCRTMAPVIDKLAVEFEGRAKVGKVDVDDNAPVAAQYGVRSIPMLLLFKDGQVVDQIIGVVPKKVLADKLDALLDAA